MSTLGCQLGLADSLADGTVWAAGRNLPGMSLAFALMAAINGSVGSGATLSHGALTTAPSLADVSPAAEEDSHPSWVAAQAPPGTRLLNARSRAGALPDSVDC